MKIGNGFINYIKKNIHLFSKDDIIELEKLLNTSLIDK